MRGGRRGGDAWARRPCHVSIHVSGPPGCVLVAAEGAKLLGRFKLYVDILAGVGPVDPFAADVAAEGNRPEQFDDAPVVVEARADGHERVVGVGVVDVEMADPRLEGGEGGVPG